jgi:Cft2 family RNA processing exonuclease
VRIDFTAEGIHLPEIGLWLDPAADSDAAWISHAHEDHAGGRHNTVLATAETIEFYKLRFEGHGPLYYPLRFGEPIEWHGARLTAFAAGHVLGSAQLLVELRGERVLYTGDVKLRPPLGGLAAETVRAHRLILESTFGLPVFHFLTREQASERIVGFARECLASLTVPVFLAHPLGRAQEVLGALAEAGVPAAVDRTAAAYLPMYEAAGFRFPGCLPLDGPVPEGAALVAPRGFRRDMEAAGRKMRVAYVSGWAALDNARARSGAEELIPYSEHADFEELLELVAASGAREVDVVHGYAEPFARILRQRGIAAQPQTAPFARGRAPEAGR